MKKRQKARKPKSTMQRRAEYIENEDGILENPLLSFQEYNEIRDRQDRKGATILKLALTEIEIRLTRIDQFARSIVKRLDGARLTTDDGLLAENQSLLRQLMDLQARLSQPVVARQSKRDAKTQKH